MAIGAQRTRRIAGLLRSRLPELHLDQVTDPRSRRGRRWKYLALLLRATMLGVMAGFLDWKHLRTTIRIRKQKHDIQTGKLLESEDHYAISSLDIDTLSKDQWLYAFRIHWGVENQCHNTWDTAFDEDNHPWIEADPKGMVAVLLLRRLAYNVLTLFRAVTQRSEERRQTPCKTLMRWVYNMLIAAQTSDLEGLRNRQVATIEV